MNRCLNNPYFNCSGKPKELPRLHYDVVIQPDGTAKRIWHRNVICSLEPHYCPNSVPCQLSLTTE
ncbi:hypothetical protein ES708_08886 [subsurface metagenome]